MKIKFLSILFITVGFLSTKAQTSYGVSAGYHNPIAKVSGGGQSASDGISGFYLSFFADYKNSEKFYIQPEIGYARSSENGGTLNQLIGTVMAKFYLSEGFNIQAGPFLDFVTDQGTNKFGIGIAVGGSYDIDDKLFALVRHSFGVNSRGSQTFQNITITSRLNIFQIGLGYRF